MGCDIHLYSETRKNGKWVADKASTFEVTDEGHSYTDMAGSYSGGRDYTLFGLLAEGVRRDCEWAFGQRGLPDDVSDEIKKLSDSWDCDGHSHNHITVPELKHKAAELLLHTGQVASYLTTQLRDLIDDLPASDTPEEQRIVFWFDN